MGKHKDDHTGFENVTQAQVNEALQPHAGIGPQSEELKAAQGLLGKVVRARVGAHMTTVILTDFESDAYHGLAIRCRSFESRDVVPHFEAVHGLRQYTPDSTHANQFVFPGEDEAPLVNMPANPAPPGEAITDASEAGDVSSGGNN